METVLQEIHSPSLEKKKITDIIHELSEVVTEAAAIRDEKFTENPILRNALSIVERFLSKRKRICYGGMAINAHLPKELKFYDFSKTLPDYDFFTPEPEKDLKELIQMFKNENYTEIYTSLSMHKGTTKLFVNYIGVADITYIPLWMYTILHKRALLDDTIYYTDADFLRMNMYLELSRPRGEVERWDKVYKRLLLLNLAKRPHTVTCKKDRKNNYIKIGKHLHETLINYIIKQSLIFTGAELKRVYSNIKSKRAGYILKSQSPIIVYAKNPEYHIPIVRQIIHDDDPSGKLNIIHWPSVYNDFPQMWGIQKDKNLIFLCIQEEHCNSYNIVDLPNGKSMNIASLDAAITLFYILTFMRGLEGIVPNSIHCFVDSLVDISIKTRDKGLQSVYPLFTLSCHGHEDSKASLLRKKEERKKKIKVASKKTMKRRNTLDL